MKLLSLFFILSLFIILFTNPLHAQFRKDVQAKSAKNITIHELLNPSFQHLLVTDQQKSSTQSGKEKATVEFSKVSKLLLGMGADLIRGSTDNLPLYNLKNGWKYPGTTIQYPTSVTEYERFLERYNRYNPDF